MKRLLDLIKVFAAIIVLNCPAVADILIINGIHWDTYGEEVILMYEERALTGSYDYSFWDLFPAPPGGRPHPETVIGEGPPPDSLFEIFDIIIWVGNWYMGDFEHWENNHDNIMTFLNNGGNLILTTKSGEMFFWPELTTFAGVDPTGWEGSNIDWHLVSVSESLTDIQRIGSQSLPSWATITGPNTTRLYKPSEIEYEQYAAGFIAEPPGLGRFIYIAGRPYRWDRDELRSNFETILGWLVEQPIPTLSEWGMLIMVFLLLAVGTVAVVRRRKAAYSRAA